MHSSINRFLSFSIFILFFNPKNMCFLLLSSSSDTRLFELHSLPHANLTFLGDSRLENNELALTREPKPTNAPGSVGVVLYKYPIYPRYKKVPSFKTMFAFSIEKIDGDQKAFGDGLAFLLSPYNYLLGSPGYLGLVDSTDITRNKFIAIEFDTRYDSIFQDPDDNHVGLDINSLFSVKLAPSSSLGVNLKNEDVIGSWIDYKSNEKSLEVFISNSDLKPNKPLLKVSIDLSDYLKENMFVGFSAATERSMQIIRIHQWKFTIEEVSPPPPPPPPPSAPESGRTFPNPAESGHGHIHSHLSSSAIGIAVGICFVPFAVLFCWFCWKKLIGIIQKSEGTNTLEMQTIRPSGGIPCQHILVSILVDRVARSLNIKKVLDNEIDLIQAKTLKSSISPYNSLPAVKPTILPPCNGKPLRIDGITSG